MTKYIIKPNEIEPVENPANKGVYLTHFFGSADNDRLNNAEVSIDPGCKIAPHIHDSAIEFIYIVRGTGEVHMNGECEAAVPGLMMMAPSGTEHAVVNTGDEPLVLLATFTPPVR